jgi:hypothetical protein
MKIKSHSLLSTLITLLAALPFVPYYQKTTTYPKVTNGTTMVQVSYPGGSIGVLCFATASVVLLSLCWRKIREIAAKDSRAGYSIPNVSVRVPLPLLLPLAFHRISTAQYSLEGGAKEVRIVHGFGDPSAPLYLTAIVAAVILQCWLLLKNAAQTPNQPPEQTAPSSRGLT